ncbi:hypothetical protein KBA27_00955 [bacterium]|nr:hypothetical protein [bacterium]
MKKFRAISVVEFSLLVAFVAIISLAGWQMFAKTTTGLSGLTTVKTNLSTLSTKDLKAKLDSLLAELNALSSSKSNKAEYNAKRTETTGVIGLLLARYKASGSSELANQIVSAIETLSSSDSALYGNSSLSLSENEAKSCMNSPSSCTTLMNVTDFSTSSYFNKPSKDYKSSTLNVKFNYDLSYIDDNGETQSKEITQLVVLQDEGLKYTKKCMLNANPNADTSKQAVSNTLLASNNYTKEAMTGSAANTEIKILDGYKSKNADNQNGLFSKSKGNYLDFESAATNSNGLIATSDINTDLKSLKGNSLDVNN